MSKAEKLKKICKKVWNLIIPIIIISAIIGSVLIAPKYYNKGGNAIETAELTVPPSHNWEILAVSILGGFFLAILILILVLNSRRKGSKLAADEVGRARMSYGKIWSWIILVVIILALLALIEASLAIKSYNKGGKKKEAQVCGVFSWELDPSQYGQVRRSLPQETVVMEKNNGVFNFTVYYRHNGKREESVFKGERLSNGRIEGTWSQERPEDGGEWHLEQNPDDIRLYNGKYRDRSGELIRMKLKILKIELN